MGPVIHTQRFPFIWTLLIWKWVEEEAAKCSLEKTLIKEQHSRGLPSAPFSAFQLVKLSPPERTEPC